MLRFPCVVYRLLALGLLIAQIAAFRPDIKITKFDGAPRGLVYFEDSPVILFHDDVSGVVSRSSDDGGTWSKVKLTGKQNVPVAILVEHPYAKDHVYALSSEGKHYSSTDRGETWNPFEIPCVALVGPKPLNFNRDDPDRVLITVEQCPSKMIPGSLGCKEATYYTTDGFKSKAKVLIEDSTSCYWAHTNKEFDADHQDSNAVLCLVDTEEGSRIAYSSDFFKTQEYVQIDGHNVNDVINFGAVSKFFVAAVSQDEHYDRVGLIVSTDLKTWQHAQFPHEGPLEESSFTILESSSHSLHVDVRSGSSLADWMSGTFFTSNSDGTVFRKSLEHTNRNLAGYVDIEQIQNIEGVLIANVFENRRIRSKISYDDGRTWSYIAASSDCSGDSKCGLNLHSITDKRSTNRIFHSPAPGLIAGIGNVGSGLSSYAEGDLWISEDSGLTWKKSKGGNHLYLFGDQGSLLISVPENQATDEVKYSSDHGKTWETFQLPLKFRMTFALTTPDSTSTKFVLLGYDPDPFSANVGFGMIHVDFSKLHSRKCELKEDGSGDFEKRYARYDADGEPNCVMGHMQYFWRKKLGAECYIGDLYHEQFAKNEPCSCITTDYECDSDFETVRSGDGSYKCVPNAALSKKLLTQCTSGDTYERPQGYRLVPGNTCLKDNKDSTVLDGKIEEKCGSESFVGSGNISTVQFEFDSDVLEYTYLKNDPDDPADETVLVITTHGTLYVSHDQGSNWETILDGKDILAMFVNNDAPNVVYFISSEGKKIYYSTDRAKTFVSIDAPANPAPLRAPTMINFNGIHPEWLIFTGEKDCDSPFSSKCEMASYYTQDYGHSWKLLTDGVQRCAWVNQIKKPDDETLIFCDQQYKSTEGRSRTKLIASNDFFQTQKEHFDHIVGFALENEFIVVATVKDNDDLRAMVSVDGETFAEAKFPHNFQVDHQQAYTVLDSSTSAVFMHVTVSDRPGGEYGALLKSNSNGTDYVISLNNVNRNTVGFVDFEKMKGLEGVAFANIVNTQGSQNGGKKKLKSVITHNDGGEWVSINPPQTGIDGESYCSGQSREKCSLHLHGYTERTDYRNGYSSPSAVGLSVAVGNVGEYLDDKKSGNMFLTRDGGTTWREVMKGTYHWEFGDSGSITALVKSGENTNILYYSLDEGYTWEEYQFSEELLDIVDIVTVPSDTSRKFIIWSKSPQAKGGKSVAIQIDFTQFAQRKCVLDSGDNEQDDFALWSPSHPSLVNGCLFGHEARYHRKIPGRDCYIGGNIATPHVIQKNCTCARQDFECDFNFAMAPDGTCQLVPGYSPPDHALVCSEMPGTVEYWEPTGYRRIPLSTCESGEEFDKLISHPCPGKEDEYRRQHQGLHGFGLFIVILVPVVLSAIVGYVVWDHYIKRYGQIRLGEEDAYKDQPLPVQYAIIAVAAVVTLVSVLPTALYTAYETVKSRLTGQRPFSYTTRDAFARRAETYIPVDPDEDRDLFIEDEDEEDAEEL